MRIAVVHGQYSSRTPSGENVVVAEQAEALLAAGHEVLLLRRHQDTVEQQRGYAARAAFTVVTGIGPSPVEHLERYDPDVVHVHNLFPNIGERWVASWPGPTVMTIHNYRHLCASAYLYRDGHACTECLDHSALRAVRYGCFHGSRVQTAPLALRMLTSDRMGLLNAFGAVVFLNERSRDLHVSQGLDRGITRVVPNFVREHGLPDQPRVPSRRWVWIGRLSEEKGIAELVDQWPPGEEIDVVGDGPLEEELRTRAGPGVTMRGRVPRDELRAQLPGYRGLVFSSRWHEGFPGVYAEALSAGLPVVTTPASVVADLVRAEGSGAVTDLLGLGDALSHVAAQRTRFSAAARASYEQRYTTSTWVSSIERVYASLVSSAAPRGR